MLGEGEQRIAGWTLLSPEDRNIKLSPKLEEKVLLLVSLPIVSEDPLNHLRAKSRSTWFRSIIPLKRLLDSRVSPYDLSHRFRKEHTSSLRCKKLVEIL